MPQTLCPLGAHSSNGRIEFGVMVKGGCHFFFSDQGPLLKGGSDVGGEYPREGVFDFLVHMFRGKNVFTCDEATSSDAKLMGGGWT